jgi:CHAP domain
VGIAVYRLGVIRGSRPRGALGRRTAVALTACVMWLGVMAVGPGEIHAAGAADTQGTHVQSAGRALPAAARTPSWWSGNCDVNNHPGSYPLGASYNGVAACGPGTDQGGSDYPVYFFPNAYPVLEWECVELVMRYMYLIYNVDPYGANGSTVVSNYSGNTLSQVSNNGSSLPSPGDIISEGAPTTDGHTGVVTKVKVSDGTGTVTMMEENASAKGWATIKVSGNVLGSGVTGWLQPNWNATNAPLPSNAGANSYALLDSVACPSAASCVAVGNYMDSSGSWQGLIEAESGTSWIPTEVTLPGNADGDPNAYLVSVACPSAAKCVAVGYYNDGTAALLVRGSGSKWTATEAPLPANAQSGSYAYLTSVACPSTTSCVAVGGYNGILASDELIDTGPAGSGTSWTPTQATLPLNGLSFYNSAPPAVACLSATSCVTAWTYDDSSGTQQGVLESGSGINWTPSEVPLPANASTSNPKVVLGSGSEGTPLGCSAAACVMVGQYADSSGNTDGLLVTGSGTQWTPSEAQLPANASTGGYIALNAVACESATTCVAVGQYQDSSSNLQGLMLTGLGTTWAPAAAPLPANALADPQIDLDSVTCPAASWCVTAGSYPAVAPGGGQTISGLAAIGSGTAWSTTSVPLPGNAYSSTTDLMSVACPSKVFCVAVGGYYDGNWNGLLATGAP